MAKKPTSQIVPISDNNQIQIAWSEFRGKRALNVRHFYLDDDDGEWKPTKKGLWVPAATVREFLATVEAFGVALNKNNLLPDDEDA